MSHVGHMNAWKVYVSASISRTVTCGINCEHVAAQKRHFVEEKSCRRSPNSDSAITSRIVLS